MSSLRTVDRFVRKYAEILGVDTLPEIKVRDNLGSPWLGRCLWTTKNLKHTVIELQQSILSDEKTLERVVAHEMIHHANMVSMSDADVALVKMGIKPQEHGSNFWQGASLINETMGDDFVTEKSDTEYVTSENKKEFFVLIAPVGLRGRLGWAWSARLGVRQQEKVVKEIERQGKLVMSTDDRLLTGAKIERYGGFSVPKDDDSDRIELLADLYD